VRFWLGLAWALLGAAAIWLTTAAVGALSYSWWAA